MNRIRTVINTDKPESTDVAAVFVSACSNAGIEAGPQVVHPDAIVAIGGDGTVLGAAAEALKTGIPVCGINVGRVGYLAEFEPTEIALLVEALRTDAYDLLPRGTVGVAVGDYSGLGVNDVVIEKVMSERIIEIAVSIDGEPLAAYRTDGMIAATPIGSTAYSLSAGGPIVSPDLDVLILTPVAPHSLLSRAIVLGPDATITISLVGDRSATINIDGRRLTTVTSADGPIVVTRGDRDIRFLSLGQHPFPQAVREQFGLDHA
jgi:NAD+ kinase